MRHVLTNLVILAGLGLLSLAVWAGQQMPPDLYLRQIESTGKLRVGIDPSYPPFEAVRDGKIEGYDAELARALGADLGAQVEFVPMAIDTMYDALAAGRVDILISALPFVYERQVDVRYSTPYYQAGQVLLVKAGQLAIASVQELAGKRVGVELGSNADTEARRLARTSVAGMRVMSVYESPAEALDALSKGEIDAAITDNTSAQAYLGAQNGALAILSPPLTDEPYVVAMPNRATGLSARVDAVIGRLRTSGELARMMGLAPR
jgi:ABC-type amino acid transport substrate-binding protein